VVVVGDASVPLRPAGECIVAVAVGVYSVISRGGDGGGGASVSPSHWGAARRQTQPLPQPACHTFNLSHIHFFTKCCDVSVSAHCLLPGDSRTLLSQPLCHTNY
jgi:hypothetical protein